MFTLPTFNLSASWWALGVTPATNPPTIAEIDCQLYIQSKSPFGRTSNLSNPSNSPIVVIRTPASIIKLGVLIPPVVGSVFGIPMPGLTTAFYKVLFWDMMHYGFPNEYVYFQCQQCTGTLITPDNRR